MKKPYIILGIIFIAILLVFGFNWYQDLLLDNRLKELVGPEPEPVTCLSYKFLDTGTSLLLENRTDTSNLFFVTEKIEESRRIHNEFYNNHSENITSFDLVSLYGWSGVINTQESIYANMKDAVDDFLVKEKCEFLHPLDREMSKNLLNAIIVSHSGSISYNFHSMRENVTLECKRSSSTTNCLTDFLNSLEELADEKKNKLPNYEKLELPECSNKVFYDDLKHFELNLRGQLNKSSDPISIIWKSVLINSTSICSEDIYTMIKNEKCPIFDINRESDAVSVTLLQAGTFANCTEATLKHELSTLNNSLS